MGSPKRIVDLETAAIAVNVVTAFHTNIRWNEKDAIGRQGSHKTLSFCASGKNTYTTISMKRIVFDFLNFFLESQKMPSSATFTLNLFAVADLTRQFRMPGATRMTVAKFFVRGNY